MSHFWPPRIPECKLTVLKNSKQSSLKSNPLLTQGNLLKWVSPREHFLDPFPLIKGNSSLGPDSS